jgi:hypothetical protein
MSRNQPGENHLTLTELDTLLEAPMNTAATLNSTRDRLGWPVSLPTLRPVDFLVTDLDIWIDAIFPWSGGGNFNYQVTSEIFREGIQSSLTEVLGPDSSMTTFSRLPADTAAAIWNRAVSAAGYSIGSCISQN